MSQAHGTFLVEIYIALVHFLLATVVRQRAGWYYASDKDNVPDLIRRAYQHQNAARHLLVKGESDYIVLDKQVVQKVANPTFEAMEAIGGTGDTLTGMLSVLCGADFKLTDAAILAARANRWSGHYADPSPATQVIELIEKIPQALIKVLSEHNGKNDNER